MFLTCAACRSGTHTAEDTWKRTGYCGLGRAVTALGLDTDQPIELDYVCSSVGSIKPNLIECIYNACQGNAAVAWLAQAVPADPQPRLGDSGLKEYESRPKGGRKAKDSAPPETNVSDALSRIRVYYPSQETVAQSIGGARAAGTICFQQSYYQAPTFPQHVLRDCKSTRKGVLMHSKMLFVGQDGPDASKAFVYVGSANLSESAW